MNFYQNLVGGEATKELGLNEDQLAFLFEKSTDLNEDIRIELNDRAIDYLEEQRKEAK